MHGTKAENALGLRPGARGRKRDGVEEVPKIGPIKDACADMMKLYRRHVAARESFNECVKAVAERSNVNSSTLKALVRASHSGDFKEHQRRVDQVQLVFEQCGEIPGGTGAD
jgi:hypothetical protein